MRNWSDHFLDQMREVGDVEADRIVSQLFAENKANKLYQLLAVDDRANVVPEDAASAFLLQDKLTPGWFDPIRLERGQAFFKKYALEIMTLLGALSLPYCYAASPGNKAIYLTGKMHHSPGKRLLDTAQFIISVLSKNGFDNGHAIFQIQRTRLIHALVRHHVAAGAGWETSWGMPVNQEDMAGTNLAFSYIVLLGLDRLGFKIEQSEKEDYLYAWRYVGHQLRIDESLLPESLQEAGELEHKIKSRTFHPSEEAKSLASGLLTHYRESFPPIAGYLVESQIRYFVGPKVSELLGLKTSRVLDGVVRGFNKVQRQINRNFVNPFSYDIMMRNHLQLRKRYSQVQRTNR